MSYEKAMKHWKNHRKDRFYQQCSGPTREPQETRTPEQDRENERISMERILERRKGGEFPIHLFCCSGGIWLVRERASLGTTQIDSYEELEQFYREYI